MRSKYAIITVYLASLSMLGLSFYLWFQENSVVEKLQAEMMQVEDELRKADTKEILSPLTGKADLSSEEAMERMLSKIPFNEKEPFSFLKTLTRLAMQSNMKNIKFNTADAERYYARGLPTGGGMQDEGFYSISIQMSAEGEFYNLIGFLRKINTLDRIVMIEGVQVSRDENILPQQRISLKLKVYTYLAPDASL